MASKGLTIAVDFDGTCVEHEYPHTGNDAEGAVEVLRELVGNDCRLILYTMRSGALLAKAEQWFKDRKIPLFAVNANPEQRSWTESPKVNADLYIDDSALGCPLRFVDGVRRPVVDRARVRRQLVLDGILD